MKHKALKTLSIWMLLLVGCIFTLSLTGVAAASGPIMPISVTWLIGIGLAGVIGRAEGYPDYSYDGLNKLIPVLFAAEAREKFYASTCLEDITMEGIVGANEIKQMGDRIWIPTTPDVPVEDHYKGDQFEVNYLESPGVEMTVDYAKRFAFGVDEIDLKQVKIKDWISRYAGDANKQVKIAVERQVFSTIYADVDASNAGLTAGQDANINLGVTGTPVTITKTNVIDKILDAAECLSDNNVPEDDNWWMVIPNWMATLIKGSDLKNASLTGDDKSPLRNKGLIGEIDRFKIYKSNLLTKDTGTTNYHVLFGHRSAIWFVTQYTKVKMFEPEKGFAQAMKGLNVHGHGVLQGKAIGEMVVTK